MRALRRWVVLGRARLRGTPRFTCGLALILVSVPVEEKMRREIFPMRWESVEEPKREWKSYWKMIDEIADRIPECYLHFHFYSFSSPRWSSVAAPSTDCQIVQWEHSSTSSIVRPFAPELRYRFCRSDERSVAGRMTELIFVLYEYFQEEEILVSESNIIELLTDSYIGLNTRMKSMK